MLYNITTNCMPSYVDTPYSCCNRPRPYGSLYCTTCRQSGGHDLATSIISTVCPIGSLARASWIRDGAQSRQLLQLSTSYHHSRASPRSTSVSFGCKGRTARPELCSLREGPAIASLSRSAVHMAVKQRAAWPLASQTMSAAPGRNVKHQCPNNVRSTQG